MEKHPCFFKTSPHLDKIAPDEPIFVLRAQDVTAPAAVEAWIKLAEVAGAPPEKLAHAHLHAQAMREWPGRKKVPD